ncbi:MAG TPA: C25 family cysteine peptidase, partial [Anaerolineae bacterium]|nr:C25 family cysteine peptidase [Anaerolineae bacterium]
APTDTYPVSTAHRTTLHLEENHLYDPAHPEAGGDHWYWADLGFLQVECPTAAQILTFQLPDRWMGSHSIDLRTSLQGYTPGTHNLAVSINGQPAGSLIWQDQTRLDCVLSFSSTLLIAGDNELRLENGACPPPPPPSPPPNGTSLNYFEVSYLAEHRASAGSLDFWGSIGAWQYEIEGFSTPDILLFDITDEGAPALLTGGRVEAESRLEFQATTTEARRYLALAGAALQSPAAIYPDVPSSLASASNRADYLLIGYGEFLAAAQPLIARRSAQGLRAMTIDVQDVYDEFSYGVMNPQAIRDLLGHALTAWQAPRPTYVVLVGDGTIDFMDHLGNGWHNFVPVYPAKVDPYLGETATDNRLAAVAGDDILPDLHIGRLPVSSVAQTIDVVAKIVSYETAPWPGWWARQVLFVADNADQGGDFPTLSDALYADEIPAPMTGHRVYLVAGADEGHEYDPADATDVERARAALSAYLGYGQLLVTYFGHASHSQWAQEILLHRDDVPDLGNGGRLPVVLSMTCYTGSFHHPPYAPLDERLVTEPGGGAVATWGPTSSALLAGHYLLAQGFLQVAFGADDRSLGAATLAGKAN